MSALDPSTILYNSDRSFVSCVMALTSIYAWIPKPALVAFLTIVSIFSITNAKPPTAAEVDYQLKEHFSGLNFTVGVIADPPFVIKIPGRGGNAAWSGISVEQIKKLATTYGFTINEFVELNMTYDEAVERVGSGEAAVDIACQIFTSTAPRERIASLTKSPVDFSFVYAKRRENALKNTFSALFAPFSLDLWACIILSLPIVSVGLTVFESDRMHDLPHGNWVMRFLRSLYSNTALMFGQLTFRPSRPESSLLILAWMLFTFSLTAIYTANLASFLTRQGGRFFLAEDLIKGKSPIALKRVSIENGTSIEYYVNGNIKIKSPGVKFLSCGSHDECVRMVKEGKTDATIFDGPVIQYLINEKYCGEVEISSEPFYPQSSSWILPMNSSYTKAFSDAIVAHRDDGSFYRILQDFVEPKKCSTSLSEKRDQIGLGTNLGGLFIVIAVLLLAAFCTYFWRLYKERKLPCEDAKQVDVNSSSTLSTDERSQYDPWT